MNKLNLKITLLMLSGLIAIFAGCSTMRFSGYPVQERMNAYSNKPLYIVEPSTATPELWSRYFAKYEIKLKLNPEFPLATDNVKIEAAVYDVSRNPKEPVTGAKVSANAVMPNTPGYIHWINNNICYFDEVVPGQCEIHSITFGTGGDWDLIVKVEIPGMQVYSAVFPVTVQGPPWPANRPPQ